MSALGQERTSPVHLAMSALPLKADIDRRDGECLLCADFVAKVVDCADFVAKVVDGAEEQ